jgi:hypothetical protein
MRTSSPEEFRVVQSNRALPQRFLKPMPGDMGCMIGKAATGGVE